MGRLTETWATDKDCGRNHGYTALLRTDAPGAAILPDYSKVFTQQQITQHCEKIDNLCLTAHPDGKLMFQGAQIIRQLQEQVKNPAFGMTGNLPPGSGDSG